MGMAIPSDTMLQNMSRTQIVRLWRRLESYPETTDWVRLAKEVRYRVRHGELSEQDLERRS